MKTFKQYSNVALFSALFMMTFFMGGCGGSSSCEDTSRTPILSGAPIITSTVPTNGAVNVLPNTVISATFSEEINPDTVMTDTFTVIDANSDPVPGIVSYSDNNTVMIFTPDNSLDYNTTYTATITTDVKDMDGNALDISNGLNVWSFTTINEAGAPPTVTSTVPVSDATNVPVVQTISATLSEPLDPGTVNTGTFTLTLAGDTVEIEGNVTYDNVNNIMFFNPTDALILGTEYTATVTTGIQDLDGNNMLEDHVWNFTTEAGDIPPYVILTDPDANETGVGLGKTITASLNEPLDPGTVNTGTFTLTLAGDTVEIEGNVTYDNVNSQMHFKPTANLTPDTEYTATVTTGIQDLDGNNMLEDYVWNFTTSTSAGQGPLPVNLGTAGNFAILTKAGVTNIPTSAITGNIGASPITAAAMNTVTCAEITGSIYGVDAAYTGDGVDITCYKGTSADKTLVDNAILDMETAYTDAAGRTPAVGANLNIDGGILDSTTPAFAPGLYTWGSNVTITDSITLTGNADDTWIFQISGNLVLASGAQIILGPDVNPENIVWQVAGTNVTIGTGAQFSGIILAKELIAVQTGASVDGRLLAQTEVTLDQNTITQPAP